MTLNRWHWRVWARPVFSAQGKLMFILIVVAVCSYWVLEKLTADNTTKLSTQAHYPDFYMENFSTLTMNQDGTPKNRLNAAYMAHYPDDTSALNKLQFEIFRRDRPPIIITADKGQVTSNNNVILLSGNVRLHQNDESGNLKVTLISEDARVLVDQEYAETDNAATLLTQRSITHAIGMRAYLQEQRLEFLSNVQTKIATP